MQIHVDTDFGGDPDDAAAVAMLLAWPDVEVVGVTTNLEVDGHRAGCAQHDLRLVDADDGRPVHVATAIDAASFGVEWLHAIERLARS